MEEALPCLLQFGQRDERIDCSDSQRFEMPEVSSQNRQLMHLNYGCDSDVFETRLMSASGI